MKKRILLTTSGGGNAQNIVRSLKKSSMFCHIVGVNADKFELAKSNADVNYLVPRFTHPDYVKTISEIVDKERIDFIIPNHEIEIQHLYRYAYDNILSKCFLPTKETVDVCINKFALISYLMENGIDNVPKSAMYNNCSGEGELSFPVWIRLIKGAGSQGAALVYDPEEIIFWIKYWYQHKGADPEDFMISEYLPGEDHHYFSLWKDGRMLVGKAIKRLKYCCAKYTLTGTSSSPSLCKMVSKPELDELTERIIKTVDPKATGLYGIDYKADIDGKHCLTEINIGRFPRINYIFNLASEPNIAELYVKCGTGEPITEEDLKIIPPDEETYFIRDFDTPPILMTLGEIESYKKI